MNGIKIFILIVGLVLFDKAYAQYTNDDENLKPKLVLDFVALDFPYISYSFQSHANLREGVTASDNARIKTADYISLVESPSMYQVMAITTSFYNAMNYGIAVGWNRLIDPNQNKRSKIWNRIGQELTAAVAFAATTKVPLAGGWAHEEFHRNVWAQYNIGSYNEIWDFNLAPDALSYVSHLYDEDLALLKSKDPAGFIRMGSSGIEAHFLTNKYLQTQDFIYNTNLPNIALYWADVFASFDYINRASSEETVEEHSEVYNDETNVLKRDFTGNDFTAWVYDLFNPYEDYENRGIHPSGIGIDRYRDYNDLNTEMLDYIEKMGNRQWLNFVSPFMVGIRDVNINENARFNFALRHYLTSFGDDIQFEFYYGNKLKTSQLVLHTYSNYKRVYPGFEVRLFDKKYSLANKNEINFSFRSMGWLQPRNQEFMTRKTKPGGLIAIKSVYSNNTVWQPYIQLEAKSKGWVAGNPYLNEKLSLRFGVNAIFGKKI